MMTIKIYINGEHIIIASNSIRWSYLGITLVEALKRFKTDEREFKFNQRIESWVQTKK